MRKTFRVRDGDKWTDVDPSEVKQNPILHRSLPEPLIGRIRIVFDALREVICCNEAPMLFEHFELGFMREVDPEGALKIWEAIASAYMNAVECFPPDHESRSTIYKWLILLVMGSVDDDDMQKEEVQIIRKFFVASFRKLQAA